MQEVILIDFLLVGSAETDHLCVESLSYLSFDTLESATTDEKDILGIHMQELLLRMLTSTLRRNIHIMQFLYLLERLRMPGLNELMLGITYLGDEMAFLVIALVTFWCIDKRQGYFLISVGFAGTVLSQFMKLACRIPRPWVRDPNFTILEQARAAATGYSFPSGHSQASVGTFGSIARTAKTRWWRAVCIAIAILVPFSRMYIGVHTPADVLVGSGISLVLIFLLYPVVYRKEGRGFKWLLAGMLVMAMAYVVYVERYPFPTDVDVLNLHHGQENAYTLLGSITAICIVYLLDSKWIRFDTHAVWWAQILKAVLGIGLALLVKEGLKAPLEGALPALTARAVRYFLTVLTVGGLWPVTFQYFAKFGRK